MVDEAKLSNEADDYFRTLPGLKYPQALTTTYPRIANKIVELKDDKKGLREYFDTLTNDVRGKRAGFPFSVLMNIQDVREVMLGETGGFVIDDTTKWVS